MRGIAEMTREVGQKEIPYYRPRSVWEIWHNKRVWMLQTPMEPMRFATKHELLHKMKKLMSGWQPKMYDELRDCNWQSEFVPYCRVMIERAKEEKDNNGIFHRALRICKAVHKANRKGNEGTW